MATVTIERKKLIEQIQNQFPNLRKPENLVDVILAGKELYAFDSSSGKKRWQFESKGAKSHSVYDAYKRYGLLDKKKAPRIRILRYMRGKAPRTDSELKMALNFERKGLYTYLTISSNAREAVTEILNLKTNSISEIKNVMEKGSIQEQVYCYDKVFTKLVEKRLYNKNYNYVMLGFRFLPDKYWLSNSAQKLLAKAKS